MALTVTRIYGPDSVGNRYQSVSTIAFDSSYATGGEALTVAQLGLSDDGEVHIEVHPSAGYVFEYDHTNNKVKAYWVDTTTDGAKMAEVASTTDLSGVTAARVVGYSTRI